MGVRGVLRTMGDGLVGFHCPGCDEIHVLNVDATERPAWDFDGNYEHPTFDPSIKVTGVRHLTDDEYVRVMGGELIEPTPRCCHSYVTAGRIRFLDDCTHDMAGQIVALQKPDE